MIDMYKAIPNIRFPCREFYNDYIGIQLIYLVTYKYQLGTRATIYHTGPFTSQIVPFF